MSQRDPTSTELLKEVETLRTQLEQELDVTVRLLRLASSDNDLHTLMREATLLLREWSGCEAVGIRLRDGDDFPYFETRGFPPEFIQAENTLCVRDLDGQLARDLQGNAVLECMCGNILCGRFNPALPFFTPNGSFWTNSTTELLASTTEADRQARTRNRCNGEGYESVALIPFRSGGATFGLLQLNDRRTGRFTIERITLIEGLAAAMGGAIGRRQSAEKLHKAHQVLRESEQRFRDLADLLPQTVYELDLEGRLTFVNRQAMETFGYTQAEFEAVLSCFQILASHEHDRARRNMQRAVDGQNLGGTEYTAQRKDGTQFPVVIYSSPILREDTPVGLRGIIVDVTEYKRAEKAMAASEVRYRRLFETAKDGILILDADTGMVLDVNPFLVDLLGSSHEAFLGKAIWELGLFKDIVANQAKFEELQQKGYVRYDHSSLETADGRPIDVELVSNVYQVNGGKVIQCNIRDVTERNRLKEEVLEAERDLGIELSQADSFEQALSHCLDAAIRVSGLDSGGVYLVDETSGDLDLTVHRGLSDQFIRAVAHFGADSENARLVALGKPVYSRYRELAVPADGIHRREGLELVAVIPIQHQGRVIACLNVASHTLDAIAEPSRWGLEAMASSIGATIVRAAERERMNEYRQDLDTLFNTVRDFLFVLDTRGDIVHVNSVVGEQLGYARTELIGKPVLVLYPEERWEEVISTFAALLAGETDTCTIPLQVKDGPRIPVETKVTVGTWRGADALIGVSRDVTDRKRAEEALRESQRRHAEAEKLAATGRMAARVAHEINNPLAGIKNSFRLIRDAVPVDHPDRDMVERIDREIARISNIVQQMYMLNSPKVGQITEAVVGDAMRDVLSMLDPLRREHKVQFDATRVLPGLSVLVPEGGLNQILYNLTTNAIEASPPGAVITIAVELDDSSPDMVRISLHDLGKGISPEVRPRIFEPFVTSKSDKHSKGGLGLGLSIVKSVVEAASGRIEFDSAPGQGTTFRVFLPHNPKAKEQRNGPPWIDLAGRR